MTNIKFQLSLAICLSLTVALTGQALAEEPVVAEKEESRFSWSLGAGYFGADGFDDSELFYSTAFAYRFHCPEEICEIIPKLVIIWIDEEFVDIWRPLLENQDLFLRTGPTLLVAPELELGFKHGAVESRWFVGAGFRHDEATRTEIAGIGTFRTASTNSPVLTYGAALVYGSKVALRLEARGVTSFLSSLDAVGPDNALITLEGGTTTSFASSAGVVFRF